MFKMEATALTEEEQHFRAELVRLYPQIRRLARGITKNITRADDLAQECVVKALSYIDSFRPGTNMGGWLYMIMLNTYRSAQRRDWRLSSLTEGWEPTPIEPSQEWTVYYKQVMELFKELPSHYREPLEMMMDGKSHEDIAVHYGMPMGTAKSRVFRARDMLVRDLKENKINVANL